MAKGSFVLGRGQLFIDGVAYPIGEMKITLTPTRIEPENQAGPTTIEGTYREVPVIEDKTDGQDQ